MWCLVSNTCSCFACVFVFVFGLISWQNIAKICTMIKIKDIDKNVSIWKEFPLTVRHIVLRKERINNRLARFVKIRLPGKERKIFNPSMLFSWCRHLVFVISQKNAHTSLSRSFQGYVWSHQKTFLVNFYQISHSSSLSVFVQMSLS